MKQLPNSTLPWPICMSAVALCADKENLRLKSYKCPAGVWTCGWGETDSVGPGMVWTKAYADQRFCDSLTKFSNEVKSMCSEPPSANELGALTVLAYNIGLGALKKSSVLKCHNKGDRAGAARAFALYNKFRNPLHGGALEVSNGLTIRRAQESALYLTHDIDSEAPVEPMPQAVGNESSMAASPINMGGAVAVGTGALSLLANNGDKANTMLTTYKSIAATIGISFPELLGVILVGVGCVVIYWRFKQRIGGWA